MGDVQVTCGCGNIVTMSEFAVGMPAICPKCGENLAYSHVSTPDSSSPSSYRPQSLDPAVGYRPPENERRVPQSPARSSPEWRNESRQTGARNDDLKPRANTEKTEFGKCDRCKRPFRGTWDMHKTSFGTLCNICANRPIAVDTKAPVAGVILTPKHTAEIQAAAEERIAVADALRTQPKVVEREPGQPPIPRQWIWVAAVVTILIAIATFVSDPLSVLPPEVQGLHTPGEPRKEVAAISKSVYWTVKGIDAGFFFVGLGLAIYITCATANKLPFESFIPNALHTMGIGLALTALQFAFSFMPCIGIVMSILASMYILYEQYNFGFMDFIYYFMYCVLGGILLFFVRTFVLGLLGLVVT
jgi:hypothetical protein